MNATDAYRGSAGEAYWERNLARLTKESFARRQAIDRVLGGRGPRLEVGAGRGFNLYAGDVAFDCDARQLAHVPSRVIPVLGEAHALPFPDCSFTAVFTVGCLMHLDAKTCVKALAEIGRVATDMVLLGEYVADHEEAISGKHWDGMLYARPYLVPGFRPFVTMQSLPPFDAEVTFILFRRI